MLINMYTKAHLNSVKLTKDVQLPSSVRPARLAVDAAAFAAGGRPSPARMARNAFSYAERLIIACRSSLLSSADIVADNLS